MRVLVSGNIRGFVRCKVRGNLHVAPSERYHAILTRRRPAVAGGLPEFCRKKIPFASRCTVLVRAAGPPGAKTPDGRSDASCQDTSPKTAGDSSRRWAGGPGAASPAVIRPRAPAPEPLPPPPPFKRWASPLPGTWSPARFAHGGFPMSAAHCGKAGLPGVSRCYSEAVSLASALFHAPWRRSADNCHSYHGAP